VNANLDKWHLLPSIIERFGIEDNPTNITVSKIDALAIEVGFSDRALLRVLIGVAIFANLEAEKCLPLIDFGNPICLPPAEQVFLNGILFFFTKVYFHFQPLLSLTRHHINAPEDEYTDPSSVAQIRLNRTLARTAPNQVDESSRFSRSLFGQAYNQIGSKDSRFYRQEYVGMLDGGQKRSFRVEFIGEGVFDNGGPYRECFSVWTDELLSPTFSLFIPCSNSQQSFGENRDRWVLNPTKRSSRDIELYRFCGNLLGCAIRGGITMNLNLGPIFWKRLLGLKPAPEDLQQSDTLAFKGVNSMLEPDVDESTFDDFFGCPWVYHNTAGESVELIPGGADRYVTYQERNDFVRMYIEARLNESNQQIDALLEGLKTVIPLTAFAAFNWKQVEEIICGSNNIDVELLKANTEYEGVSSEEPHIYYFWEVLHELTQEQRSQFLQFCWARKRLPTSKSAWTSPFKIQNPSHQSESDADASLLHAATCFFTIQLPRYSSKEILKKRLLTSIECITMDADIRVSAAQVEEAYSNT